MQRRKFLQIGAGTLGLSFLAPSLSFASDANDTRFIFIIQRGAADGLNIVIPYADPNYRNIRKELAIENGNKLDGTFTLHPALQNIYQLYLQKQASFVHAVASPYRERSHFDGQNILEGGFTRAYELDNGWLNRFLAIAPKQPSEPIAFMQTLPLAMRGKNSVTSYAPSNIPDANEDLMMRISNLYENDPKLYDLWLKAEATRNMGQSISGQGAAAVGKMVGSFLAKPNGPRIAMLESQGWDTHSGQNNRLNGNLKDIDTAIGAMKSELGDAWNKTIIIVATEFGRTAHANGTGGTDHGTASCAMVLGGAIDGGKVIADWPGLSQSSLYEGRDLKPTNDLFGVISYYLGKGFNIEPQKVAQNIFAQVPNVKILRA